MRALFSTLPGSGHFLPLLPLARGLRDRGHDIRFAASPAFADEVAEAGFPLSAVGRPWLIARFHEAVPELTSRTGEDRALLAHRLGFAGPVGVEAATGVAALLRRERFDLVVFEGASYGGGLAAEAAGRPRAAVGSGILSLDRRWIGRLAPELGAMQDALGLARTPPAEALFRDLVLSAVPAAFYGDADLPPTFAAFCLDSHEAPPGAPLPDALDRLASDRPTAYVTLGSVQNKRLDVFRAVLDGLAGEAVNIVVTTGRDVDPATLDPVPPNALVTRFIPQAALLPRCDVVVHHAGSGTLRGATYHGLPQLLLPITGDQPRNAGIAAGLGFALVLEGEDVTPAAVAVRVRELLSRPGYRSAAERIGAEMRSLPPLEAALDRLEGLAAAAGAATA